MSDLKSTLGLAEDEAVKKIETLWKYPEYSSMDLLRMAFSSGAEWERKRAEGLVVALEKIEKHNAAPGDELIGTDCAEADAFYEAVTWAREALVKYRGEE